MPNNTEFSITSKSDFEQIKNKNISFDGYVSGLIPGSDTICYVKSRPTPITIGLDKRGNEIIIGLTMQYTIVPAPKIQKGGWIHRIFEGKNEIFFDRNTTSQQEAEKRYGKNVKYIKNDGVVTYIDQKTQEKIQYRLSRGAQNKGVVVDQKGDSITHSNSRNIQLGNNTTIFATGDNNLDPGTLHRNLFSVPYEWFGQYMQFLPSTYIGPTNPKTYGDPKLGIKPIDNYDYLPTLQSDWAAYWHDKDYDALGLIGPPDAIFNTKALKADIKLTLRSAAVVINPNTTLEDKLRGGAVAVAFGNISLYKIEKWLVLDSKIEGTKKVMQGARAADKAIKQKAGEAYMKSHVSPRLPYSPF